jgi:hypothetical protein
MTNDNTIFLEIKSFMNYINMGASTFVDCLTKN